jgi:excisionase family DNA binding protein
MEQKQLLRADQVAKMLGVSKGTVFNWSSTGKLPSLKIFGALRFDPEEIEKLIEQAKSDSRLIKRTQ